MNSQLGMFDTSTGSLDSMTAETQADAQEVLTWRDVLSAEKEKPYFKNILAFLESERAQGKTIYPPSDKVFNALKLTPFHEVKVVILGQDPYHGPNQAHGLSFSVQKGITKPPSLINIFKELDRDLGIKPPQHGCLDHWSKQGVLLLNTGLSVEAGKPQSHGKLGWEVFTDKIIFELNHHHTGIVFILWGAHAQKKNALIEPNKHLVIASAHPSPFSADRGFFGSKPFSRANEQLRKLGKDPIDWSIPE